MTEATNRDEEIEGKLRGLLVDYGQYLIVGGTITLDELLAEAMNLIHQYDLRQRIIDADTIYTNEHDRKLWNEFKEVVLGEQHEY